MTRKYQQRIDTAGCVNGRNGVDRAAPHHAWVVRRTAVDEEGYVEINRVCLACREESSHLVTQTLFMGIQLEHLWMVPDVRLGV